MNFQTRKARTGILLSGALASAALLAACGSTPAAAPPPTPRPALAVAVSADAAHRAEIRQTLALSGEVRATQQISVLPKASGQIQQVLIDNGTQVKAGDIIATLDQDGPQLQLEQARAGMAQAQARLDTLRGGPRSEDVAAARAAVAQQQARLNDMRHGGRAEDIRGAEDGVAAAKARFQALVDGADDGVRQTAQSAVDADKDALASARAAFAALGAQHAANLQAADSQIETLSAQIDSAKAQIAAADATLTSSAGSTSAELQAAQSAYDQAVSQLQTAQAALKQDHNPPQAAIAQANAAVEAAKSQRAAAQAQRTALAQKAPLTACGDAPGAPHNGAACNSAKAAAGASVDAAEAAVEAAQGQLDLLRRGGPPAQQTQLQGAADQARAQVDAVKARLDALNSGGIAAERAQAEAQKQQAQGQLIQAQASLEAARASRHALEAGSLDVQVKSAQAQVTATTERLKSDQARLEVILGGPTDAELQQAQAVADQAEQQLAKARQPYSSFDVQAQTQAVAQAQAQLDKALNPYTDQDLSAAQAAVEQAQAQLDTALLALSNTNVVAPVDGVVAERLVAPGAFVSPQVPLVRLVPPSLEVVADVAEADLGRLAAGQPAQIQVASQSFDGLVESIAPTLDAKTRTATVHIRPSDSASGLRAGMFAQVSVTTAQHDNALLVPVGAIVSANGESQVVAIDDANMARLRTVHVGLQNDQSAEILSGLEDDQLVATSNAGSLRDGQTVAPRTSFAVALAQ